jgi:5'(3')-deoxyribonucleotidase
MRILVDMDGVVADLISGWIANIYQYWNKLPESTHSYNVVEWYPTLNQHQVMSCLNYDSFRKAPVIEEAQQSIEGLILQGHEIRFATTIYPDLAFAYEAKCEWVKEHFPSLIDNIIVFSSRHKTEIRSEVLIEDHPKTCADFKALGGTPILFSQPWNAKYELDGIQRVDNWPQVLDTIGQINGRS